MMKAYFEKKTAGFYITALATVLTLVGLFFYGAAENADSRVFLLAGAAIAVEVLLIAGTYFAGNRAVFNLATSASAILMALAVAISFYTQLDAIGYVVSGLYTSDKITSFAVFVVLGVAALIFYCVASFMNLGKED